MAYTVAAFYQFFPFSEYVSWRAPLKERMRQSGIRGTILLAPEGINSTLAGTKEAVAELLAAVSNHDTARALVAVATAIDAGRDPRGLGEGLLGSLRDAFLVALDAPAGHLGEADRAVAAEAATAIGAAGLTRALELLGSALIEMRQAADPRIPLEVALVRITDASTDTTLGGLAERVGRLEREVARARAGRRGSRDVDRPAEIDGERTGERLSRRRAGRERR